MHLCTRAWPQFWAAENWPYYKDVLNSVGLIDWMRYVLVLYACNEQNFRFGVCCVFKASTSGARVSENCTYLQVRIFGQTQTCNETNSLQPFAVVLNTCLVQELMLSNAQNVLSLKGTRWRGVISALWIRDNLPPESWLSNTDHRHFICIIHHPEEQQRRVLPAPWLWHGARFKRKKNILAWKIEWQVVWKTYFSSQCFNRWFFSIESCPCSSAYWGPGWTLSQTAECVVTWCK